MSAASRTKDQVWDRRTEDETQPRVSPSLRVRLFALFALELILAAALKIPDQLLFRYFAFGDLGSNFTLQYLVRQGLKPGIDFGYPYGLLAALAGRLWFGAAGATPLSYMAVMLVCGLLIAWALADVAAELRVGFRGLLLLFVALPLAIQVVYANLAQALEAALIANALAAQARGRIDEALCLTAAAVFTKPALGFVYAVVLLALALPRMKSWRDASRLVVPALFTVIALSIVLSSVYGLSSLVRTILPTTGVSIYRVSPNFGHFALNFWWRPDLGWPYYLMTAAGFWTVATIWIIISATQLRRLVIQDRTAQMIIVCAVLHVTFFTLMFGNRFSWYYYSYILIIGVALTTSYVNQWNRLIIPALTALAVSAQTSSIIDYENHLSYVRSAETFGLKADPQELAEWQRASRLVQGRRAVVLAEEGDAALRFPQSAKPVALYLVPGLTLPAEAARQAQQIEDADVVVATAGIQTDLAKISNLPMPIFSMKQVFAGRYLDAYTRKQAQR
jgi:hypothetical protein